MTPCVPGGLSDFRLVITIIEGFSVFLFRVIQNKWLDIIIKTLRTSTEYMDKRETTILFPISSLYMLSAVSCQLLWPKRGRSAQAGAGLLPHAHNIMHPCMGMQPWIEVNVKSHSKFKSFQFDVPKGVLILLILPKILIPGHKWSSRPSGGQKIQWFIKWEGLLHLWGVYKRVQNIDFLNKIKLIWTHL